MTVEGITRLVITTNDGDIVGAKAERLRCAPPAWPDPIPASERLPEPMDGCGGDSAEVLAYDAPYDSWDVLSYNHRVRKWHGFGFIERGMFGDDSESVITHWLPLPPRPPKV